MKKKALVRIVAVLLFSPVAVMAQSAQAHGVQASVLAGSVRFNGTNTPGLGFETQLRFNRVRVTSKGAISVGIGVQRTQHNLSGEAAFASRNDFTLSLAGLFIEPRLAFDIGSIRWFPYFSLRLAALQQSSPVAESTFGGAAGAGFGMGYTLTTRVNIDAGVALLVQTFGETQANGSSESFAFSPFLSYAAKLGFSFGF